MSEQEKKRQRMYSLLNAKTKPKFFLSTVYKANNFFLQKNIFLRKRRNEGLYKKKSKEGFLTDLVTAFKKEPTASTRKQVNELKLNEKTVGRAIKQDFLAQALTPLITLYGAF